VLDADANHGLRVVRHVVPEGVAGFVLDDDVEIANARSAHCDDGRALRLEVNRETRLASFDERPLLDRSDLRETHRRERVVEREKARVDGLRRRDARDHECEERACGEEKANARSARRSRRPAHHGRPIQR